MQDCFKHIIGLSNRDCDCFLDGRPDAGGEEWENIVVVLGGFVSEVISIPGLPTEQTAANVQYFKNGVLIGLGDDFVTGEEEVTISGAYGDLVQIWYKTAKPALEAYKESDSGLYITDLVPEEEIAGLASCDKTLWSMFESARTNAVREFRAAVNAKLQRKSTLEYHTFVGNIGKMENDAGALVTDKQYAGVRIRTNPISAGYIKITRIAALFTGNGTVNVTVLDGAGMVVSPAFSITTKAGRPHVNAVDIKLPLRSDFTDETNYYLVFEYDEANKPILNKALCSSCSGFSPSTSTANPAFSNRRDKHAWANYIVAGGWIGNDIVDFSDAGDQVSQHMNGLALEAEIGCDLNLGLCSTLGGFDNNPWAGSIAQAIRAKAAAILMRQRLMSSKATRQASVNQDSVREQVARWEAEYAEVVQYLAANLPPNSNECLNCNGRMKVQGILS